ncbi:MAG: F0F1 ATP synthase subunit delta [Patescibacteria group bacterium]
MRLTPRTYAEALYESVKAASEKELPAIMRRLLQLLQRRRHWNMLPKIIRAFDEVLFEKEGMIAATFTSGKEHGSTHEKEWIKQLLNALYPHEGKRNVVLERIVDPSVIGGMKMKVRGFIYDASIEALLKKLREKLSQTQH